jgi:cysteine desulfurase
MARLPGTVVYGIGQPRLPNTSYLRFGMLHADVVLQRLEQLGVMASSGAACSSSGQEPSAVLRAMGVPRAEALCAIRLSLSPATTHEQVQYVLHGLPQALAPLMEAPAGLSAPTVSPTGVFA